MSMNKKTMTKIGVAIAIVLLVWCLLRLKRTRNARRVIVTSMPTLQGVPVMKAEKYEGEEYEGEDYEEDGEDYEESEEYEDYREEPYTEFSNVSYQTDLLE